MADQELPPETPSPEPDKPRWEKRDTFGINERMKEVISLTKGVAEKELESLRRKLEKLQYGS